MSEKPKVKPGDWITIGKKSALFGLHAVVCTVYEESNPLGGDLEVVYLDRTKQAINEDVVWRADHWDFKVEGPNGGYADKYDRLQEYVSILRLGRHR